MEAVKTKPVEATPRTLIQNARLAVRDVYDAIVELVTNADDRYQFLGVPGKIEIEVERHRKGEPNVLRVRDFADGMTADDMWMKLSYEGARVSGMQDGKAVRGTNSRGAKDVAALGRVTFQSIGPDGEYHECEITRFFDFNLGHSRSPTRAVRRSLGIADGTGTLVTLEVDSTPQHENLGRHLSRLVSLRDILNNANRTIVLRDVLRKRQDTLTAPLIEGHDRLKTTLAVPGYPGVTAKLVVKRAKERFERESDRFRLGGILVKSRHAVHEATYFDSALESDPHAAWFYGRLICDYIDDLSNAYDDRVQAKLEPDPQNPVPIVDPNRRSGLTRQHPFVESLYREALRHLRPLVEEERKREERERKSIESAATRKRLDALEAAASKFMDEHAEQEEPSRDPDAADASRSFKERGFALNPPFCQLIKGHSQKFWLGVAQEAFPEFEVGASVQVECLTPHVSADRAFCSLEPHPSRVGVLRALWTVTARAATPATGIRVRVGSNTAESVIEVLDSEADIYKDVSDLCFSKRRYSMRPEAGRKRVRLLAPLSQASAPTKMELATSDDAFSFAGEAILRPRPNLGVAIADLWVKCTTPERSAVLQATMAQSQATAKIRCVERSGTGITIRLEPIDLGNQRYRWRQNVLEIASEHPSLRRYLGAKADGFPGQEAKHFRLLLAEIVADAVCARLVALNAENNPEEYQDADWDTYYARFDKLRTRFLPLAHELQCPDAN